MKKSGLVIALILISFLLSAQEYCEWTEPQIITDVNSVYANPYVAVYNNASWVFYEKQEEVNSIYKMDLNNISDNILLLSSESVNYKSPFFVENNNPDFIGYLFYLCDEEAIFNLYAAKLFEDNSLGSPIKVIQNPENKDIMDYSINWGNYIGYTIDSVVSAAELKFYSDSVYTERETILDSSAFNAQINYRSIFWQRMEMDSSHILNSVYEYNADSGFFCWEAVQNIDSVGDSRWLISSKKAEDWYGFVNWCWVKNNSVLGIEDGGSTNHFTINTYSKPNVRQISMINWGMGVKNELWDLYYLCFATGTDDESEIYCSNEYCSSEGVYLSDNNYPDDNPEVYFGEFKSSSNGNATYYVYCIWQSHIDGNIALSMSKSVADFTSSINENEVTNNYLKVSPNPFTENLSISFNTYGQNAQLKIFDVYGQQINSFKNLNSNSDWQNIVWNPASKISKGIYIVSLNIDRKIYTRRVIRQ